MKLPCFELLCLFIILSICDAKKRNGKPKYCRAAVLELKQYNDLTSSGMEIINKNLGKYEVAASLAADNNVDILVYPEKGLFPMKLENATWFLNYAEDIPRGKEKANPCKDNKFSNSPILRNLSCTAQKYNIFVVATLFDIKKCEVKNNCKNMKNKNSCVTDSKDCPDSGNFIFNTLVAFKRDGTLVARYYKRHVFTPLEKDVNTPKYPEPAYFKDGPCQYSSDIGFDFLFNDSFIDIQKRPETSAVAYANWWFDHTPPHYFAAPLQQSWSLTNKVTVLSSDVQAPNLASLGSGIYLPKIGAVVYSYNPDGKSKLLISNIPASRFDDVDKNLLNSRFFYINDDDTVTELNGEEPREFKDICSEEILGMNPAVLTDYRCKHTEVKQYTFVKLNGTEGYTEVCSNNFCCSLEYKAESMSENFYFGVSGNLLEFYDIINFGVQSCILARCDPVGLEPCRNFHLKSNTKFLNVKITGSFDTDHIYPSVINSELRLSNRDEWYFDGTSQLFYQNIYGNNLLYADLYGRLYERDEPINKKMPSVKFS